MEKVGMFLKLYPKQLPPLLTHNSLPLPECRRQVTWLLFLVLHMPLPPFHLSFFPPFSSRYGRWFHENLKQAYTAQEEEHGHYGSGHERLGTKVSGTKRSFKEELDEAWRMHYRFFSMTFSLLNPVGLHLECVSESPRGR